MKTLKEEIAQQIKECADMKLDLKMIKLMK